MTERAGLGPEPKGPSFTPWHASAPGSAGPPAPPVRDGSVAGGPTRTAPSGSAYDPALRPPRNPWPTLLTVIALVVVGTVVVVASVVGDREQLRPAANGVAAPVPARSSAPATPARSDRMEFVSDDGDGVLVITRRAWSSAGDQPPVSGSYLHVEVELVCTTGQLSYAPENFSAFDATGDLFDVTGAGRWGTPLGYGTLDAGESVRGTIAFDLPRGEVTLLPSDAASRSVTALKIPD